MGDEGCRSFETGDRVGGMGSDLRRNRKVNFEVTFFAAFEAVSAFMPPREMAELK